MNCKFSMGKIVITPGALERLNPEEVTSALSRHGRCDWGECCKEDVTENEIAIEEGFRLFSVYRDQHGTKFWIISEADRSVTTILLPEEY